MERSMRETGDEHAGEASTLETKTGGGCMMLFGLPFFAAGIAVMTVPFWADGDAPAAMLIPFGLVFASVGGGIMFGRAGIIADKTASLLSTCTEIGAASTTDDPQRRQLGGVGCREHRGQLRPILWSHGRGYLRTGAVGAGTC